MSKLLHYVDGSPAGPVGTVYGLGRNFAAHAREMKAAPEPVVFIMPASALLPEGGKVRRPAGCRQLHHEVELVLWLRAGGIAMDRESAREAIGAVALGLDLTARDIQAEAKQKGAPWARSKGFPGAAPISRLVPSTSLESDFSGTDLSLEVDGQPRQQGRSDEMLLDPPAVVALLSRWFELEAGDVVFTGTPEGVGPVLPGQRAVARSRALGLELAVQLTD